MRRHKCWLTLLRRPRKEGCLRGGPNVLGAVPGPWPPSLHPSPLLPSKPAPSQAGPLRMAPGGYLAGLGSCCLCSLSQAAVTNHSKFGGFTKCIFHSDGGQKSEAKLSTGPCSLPPAAVEKIRFLPLSASGDCQHFLACSGISFCLVFMLPSLCVSSLL